MTSRTKTFFDELSQRGHVSWLEHEHGRIRFEVVDGDQVQRWAVSFDDGDVRVDRDGSQADGVLRADGPLFDRMLSGEEQMLPAILRGECRLDGSVELIIQFSRLLPGPAGQNGPRFVDRDEPR